MWALDDFTVENGATLVVPGSHRWPPDRRAVEGEAVAATMPAGSVLFYAGSLLHAGGANRTTAPRLGVILEYCAGWLRPQENHVLGVPKTIVRELPDRLRELLGYGIHGSLLGYVDGRHPAKFLSDERAVESGVMRRGGRRGARCRGLGVGRAVACRSRSRSCWRPLTSAVLAQPARVIDLATFGTPAGELTRIFGSSQVVSGDPASGAFGVPVAGGGDLDDDGFQDFAFASLQADPLGRVGAGEILVVFGDGTFGGTMTTAGFSADLLKIAGQHAGEVAGVRGRDRRRDRRRRRRSSDRSPEPHPGMAVPGPARSPSWWVDPSCGTRPRRWPTSTWVRYRRR